MARPGLGTLTTRIPQIRIYLPMFRKYTSPASPRDHYHADPCGHDKNAVRKPPERCSTQWESLRNRSVVRRPHTLCLPTGAVVEGTGAFPDSEVFGTDSLVLQEGCGGKRASHSRKNGGNGDCRGDLKIQWFTPAKNSGAGGRGVRTLAKQLQIRRHKIHLLTRYPGELFHPWLHCEISVARW